MALNAVEWQLSTKCPISMHQCMIISITSPTHQMGISAHWEDMSCRSCRTTVGAVGAAHDSDRTWCLSGITVGLSELLSDYCRTTVGLSGSVGLLSEVTVGLSDRGSVAPTVLCGLSPHRGPTKLPPTPISAHLVPPSPTGEIAHVRRWEQVGPHRPHLSH